PLAGVYRRFLVLHAGGHVDAMGDAMGVGNDEAGAVVGFGFEEGLEGVLVFGAHGDAGDIDVAVAHGHHAEIFFASGFAAGGELGDCGARRGLGLLPAGVGVDLGVEHEQVDVFAAGDDVIQAAIADVISPAVATDDPDTLFDQHVGEH